MPAPTRLIRLSELDQDAALRSRLRGGAVSIGNFDGVHAGHRQLLRQVRIAADRHAGAAVAVVLDPHPARVLRPHSAPPRLTTIDRRAELMSQTGIDFLLVCPTTIEFLNRTAEQFFRFLIEDRLDARAMIEGPNFFFGRDRGGDIHRLRELCEQSGRELEIAQPEVCDGRMVSSSRIREAISAGDLVLANEMLRSNYQMAGRVVRGEGRGRTIGFPTANLGDVETLIPENGVYAARVIAPVQSAAAVHIGPNPTFDDQHRTKIEVHMLDYNGDVYDREMVIEFIDHVRPVRKFENAEQLTRQLTRDIERVRQINQILLSNP